MKKIPLTQGRFAIVDDEDYPYLSRFHWQLVNSHASLSGGTYPYRWSVYMENFIIEKNKHQRYVFWNSNTLDCRKENITTTTWGAASHHGKKWRREVTSPYKGVCWDKRSGMWNAKMTRRENNKRVTLLCLYFDDEKEAARAYNVKALEIWGDLAYQNIID
jgi:hypothetical protein